MLQLFFVICMGVLGRLSGNGFGKKWGVSWLPELLHSIPYGVALGYIASNLGEDFVMSLFYTALGTVVSYAGMQSATWMFLDWEGKQEPDAQRDSTMKPIIDRIAAVWEYKLGDEGYSWIACAVKGFLTTLPVGGLGVILFPLGDEIGSHFKGRSEQFGLDSHAVREFMRSALGALSIVVAISITESVV